MLPRIKEKIFKENLKNKDHIYKTLKDERSKEFKEKEAKVSEQVINSYIRTNISEAARIKRRHHS